MDRREARYALSLVYDRNNFSISTSSFLIEKIFKRFVRRKGKGNNRRYKCLSCVFHSSHRNGSYILCKLYFYIRRDWDEIETVYIYIYKREIKVENKIDRLWRVLDVPSGMVDDWSQMRVIGRRKLLSRNPPIRSQSLPSICRKFATKIELCYMLDFDFWRRWFLGFTLNISYFFVAYDISIEWKTSTGGLKN